MLSITIGGRKPQYAERGINGHIEDLLFPIHHGMLWYTWISIIPPEVIYQAHSLTEAQLNAYFEKLKEKLVNIQNLPVIPYRFKNYGDYDEQQLKPELVIGRGGFSIHLMEKGIKVSDER